MTRYTKAFFGQEGNPHFDLAKAVEAYEWVLAHPDEAPFVVSKMLFDNTAFYMEAQRDKIEPVVKSYVSKRLGEVKLGLSRRVSKSETAGEALGVVEAISKAAEEDDGIITDWEQSERAKRQARGPGGRFRVMNRKIVHSESGRPLDDGQFRRMAGVKTEKIPGLSKERKAAYQNDYLQVLDSLRSFQDQAGLDNTTVFARYNDGSVSPAFAGSSVLGSLMNGHNNDGPVRVDDYREGKRVEAIEVIADTPMSRPTRSLGVDALTAMTSAPGFANFAMDAAAGASGATGAYLASTDRQPGDYGTNEQMWRRLSASSKLAYDMGGKYLPDNAQFALKVGEWAGNYAPQAEKVIGPTARRGAYRYRGVEKEPNRVYQNDIDSLRHEASNGREAHEWLVYGKPLETPKRSGDGTWEDREPSKTVEALRKTLPDPALYELNRKSGTIPPSQGIIIDRSGKVVTEAVGYGEDWYVPFNLRNLSKLKGGEYIRTRAYGGLTTEDIYVGLVSGARAVTVVSHSGTYTLEFDDDFRGARRYNDKSGRMHARYAQLLDAVKSGDVTLAEPSAARQRELLEDAADKLGLDPDEDFDDERLQTEYKKARIRERRNPQLAREDRNAAVFDAVDQHIMEQGRYKGVNDYLNQRVARGEISQDDAYGMAADPMKLASEVGAERKAKVAIQRAEMVNRENLNPLILNGNGYGKALKALQDQFPYYISRAEFVPTPGMGAKDLGYVKPKFNRPEGALDGFYDETINGKGKLSADKTNYQNYANYKDKTPYVPRDQRMDKPKDETAEEAPEAGAGAQAAPAAKPAGSPAFERIKERNALLETVKAIQAQERFSDSALDGFDGAEINDEIRSSAKLKALYMPIDELRVKLATDPNAARDVRAAIEFARSKKFYDVDFGSMDNPGARVKPLPDTALDIFDGIATGSSFDIPDVRAGRKEEQYDAVIGDILAKRTEFRALGSKDGVNPLVTADAAAAEVIPVLTAYAAQQTDLAMQWQEFRAGSGPKPAGDKTDGQLTAEAKDLARLIQAYKNREAVRTPKEPAPKAEASDREAADTDLSEKLIMAAKPHQDKVRSMIGLSSVADEMDTLVAQAIAVKRREAAGLPVDDRPMHLVFTGNPGTGKTTVAKIIAPLYHDLGLIKKKTVHLTEPSKVTGEYANQVREHTRKFLDSHKGGVIFIDEAHQLADDELGRQAIKTMVPWASENRDTVIILAGYPNEMNKLLKTDPGLSSRFPKKVRFRDYSGVELNQIAEKMMSDRQYSPASPAVSKQIKDTVGRLHGLDDFANGRSVETFINHMRANQELRLLHAKNPDAKQLSQLTKADVDYAVRVMGLDGKAAAA